MLSPKVQYSVKKAGKNDGFILQSAVMVLDISILRTLSPNCMKNFTFSLNSSML